MARRYAWNDSKGREVESNALPDLSNINTGNGPLTRGAGKGSDRRRSAISEAEISARWCATFGHQPKHGVCRNCGLELAA